MVFIQYLYFQKSVFNVQGSYVHMCLCLCESAHGLVEKCLHAAQNDLLLYVLVTLKGDLPLCQVLSVNKSCVADLNRLYFNTFYQFEISKEYALKNKEKKDSISSSSTIKKFEKDLCVPKNFDKDRSCIDNKPVGLLFMPYTW
jgi:hypothetical protein